MIVACPNCQSKFNLPDDKIGPDGAKLRCGKCRLGGCQGLASLVQCCAGQPTAPEQLFAAGGLAAG